MSIKRTGFTLIEIVLFLAITGLLFVGIVAGTGNSIAQQRFTDSVQSFTELLRSVYSEVSNPQSVGEGRSETAIYGKLISFGQTTGLDGEKIDELDQRIFIYDVVGKVNHVGDDNTGKITEVLSNLGANVAIETTDDDGKKIMEPAGEIRSYTPRWGASIEKTDLDYFDSKKDLFVGSILIVRHPRSGTINTLVSKDVIQINSILASANIDGDFRIAKGMLLNPLDSGSFETREVDFCIDPRGIEVVGNNRRDIRLVKNARNASGVEIIDLDLNEIRAGEQIGNRCRF